MAHRLIRAAAPVLAVMLSTATATAQDRRPLALPGGLPAGVSLYLRAPFCSGVGRVDIETDGSGILSDRHARIGLLLGIQTALTRQCPGLTKLTFSGRENGELVYAGMLQQPWEEEVALYAP